MTTPVTFADVADNVTIVSGPLNIRRIDGVRSATVSALVTDKDVGAVTSDAQELIDAAAAEYGVEAEQGGVAEYMNETFTKMGVAMVLAILISFAIVVISFRSLLSALLIMVSLPLSTIGAFLGLLATGHTIGASAMMGMLMLVGIVLTNAIVLLALVDQLRQQGMSTHDALVISGRTRIRPILMTAITTMVGLVPLALGFGEGIHARLRAGRRGPGRALELHGADAAGDTGAVQPDRRHPAPGQGEAPVSDGATGKPAGS